MGDEGTALLREAASLMRERANGASPGPWRALVDSDGYVVGSAEFDIAFMVADAPQSTLNGREDAEHLASWHPAVALAVADWLDEIAETHEADPSDYCGGKGHADYGDEWSGCSSWWCSTVARALAVANAYLSAPPPAVGGPKEDG